MARVSAVGSSLPVLGGEAKASGNARFAADVILPGMAAARLLLSPHAHAEILSIDARRAEAMPGVYAVVTRSDIPPVDGADLGARAHSFLARRFVVFAGQPIAAVAAADPATAEAALEAIEVHYNVLPAVVDLQAALIPEAPVVSRESERPEVLGPDGRPLAGNVAGHVEVVAGDVDAALAAADVVVEGSFSIPMFHQAYLEPHGVVAHWDEPGHVNVWACVQNPFGARDAILDALGLPASAVTFHTTEIGGGFGGKDAGLFGPVAVWLAKKAQRPVRLALTREEDMLAANPSPGVAATLRVAAQRNGTLAAVAGAVHVNVGAHWGSAAQDVAFMILHKYRVPAYRINAVDVATNTVSFGSYRAPQALQAAFVIESLLDDVARKLELDPLALRERNLIREGETSATGRTVPPHGGFRVLEEMRRHPLWRDRVALAERGTGLLVGHGAAIGLWGSGTFPSAAVARLERGGYVRFVVGQVDLTGAYTSLAQIAADTLGISSDRILMTKGDTDCAPYASVSGGSSTIYSMGIAVRDAAADLRARILARAAKELDAAPEDLDLDDGGCVLRGQPGRRCSLSQLYTDETEIFSAKTAPHVARGASGSRLPRQSAPCFAGALAEVAVDPATGRVQVTRLVAVQDVGKAINPQLVEGQMQGAVVQSVGAALWEGIAFDNAGRMLNPSFLDYRVPTAADVPLIETVILEEPGGDGPFGAKGVGEPPVIAPAAAIANAVADAIGHRITDLPITPERIWAACAQAPH